MDVDKLFIEYAVKLVTNEFKPALKWLCDNETRLKSKSLDDKFDYPNYWDMPRDISYFLDPDEVDFIQELTHDWGVAPTLSIEIKMTKKDLVLISELIKDADLSRYKASDIDTLKKRLKA